MSTPFVPSNINFVKARATELHKAVPYVSQALALETTAVAFGYSGWHDACTLIGGKQSKRSAPDEDVDPRTRLLRRHQQGCALTDIANLPAVSADFFVRLWNPTSGQRNHATRLFSTAWVEQLQDLREWEVREADDEEYEDDEYFRPRFVAPDCLHYVWQQKLYGYFVPSDHALAALPPYIRGNASSFLDFEDAKRLRWVRPDWFVNNPVDISSEDGSRAYKTHWAWHQWLQKMQTPLAAVFNREFELATAYPEAEFIISMRTEMTDDNRRVKMNIRDDHIPTLSGADLAQMYLSGGHVKAGRVKWYQSMPGSHIDPRTESRMDLKSGEIAEERVDSCP
ncbi:MAG: hypothetical protein JWN04_4473, partial [Myxococcaceae bacterium]|nr:hypothetical protein [Myxococcaceae bacterium]